MSKIGAFWNKVCRKLRNQHYRSRIKNKDFTLIAQNCVGGVIYSQLGMEFSSPTINMFIEDENFLKLVQNLEYYMSVEPHPVNDAFQDPVEPSVVYPKIGIDDIELCCLHYKNCADAIAAWNRRRKRVNLNNVFVIGNSWNMHENYDLVRQLSACKYKTVIFTMQDTDIPNCIKLMGDFWRLDARGIVRPNITDTVPGSYLKYYEQFFDFVSWLNG